MTLELTETQISDLFFGFDKEELDIVYRESDESGTDEDAIQEALRKDAERFSDILSGQVTAEWLINDYNKRV